MKYQLYGSLEVEQHANFRQSTDRLESEEYPRERYKQDVEGFKRNARVVDCKREYPYQQSGSASIRYEKTMHRERTTNVNDGSYIPLAHQKNNSI